MSAGRHVDGKNVIGSYSALAVFETGKPFCGGFYVLPQYHLALDIRQGDVHATQNHRFRRQSQPSLEAFCVPHLNFSGCRYRTLSQKR